MSDNEKVIVRSRSGTKLCEIEAPQGWQSWLTIPTPVPFLGIGFHNVWKEPERVIAWAWLQSFQIVQSIREPSSISRQSQCQCVICGQNSIVPQYGSLWNRQSVIGFRCLNKGCKMFEVTIPAVLTTHLMQMPEELFAEILSHLSKQNSTRDSESLTMVIWFPKESGKGT
jgi:hypothetical protein